ncbi:hypothetical protein M405DRAFT_811118 [Rhizopogon salebrosus TDB-379]|nr:hypothetical protein M405DRAFT_811118 [Rhizopogon salebrosus TDB-379]
MPFSQALMTAQRHHSKEIDKAREPPLEVTKDTAQHKNSDHCKFETYYVVYMNGDCVVCGRCQRLVIFAGNQVD